MPGPQVCALRACVGTHHDVLMRGPYDLVVCNPPYLPAPPDQHSTCVTEQAGPSTAWDAGPDGRMVLDPLCESAAELLADGGELLIVQSEFADPQRSIRMLGRRRIHAEIVLRQRIPFGPVLTDRAPWMESMGLLAAGRREEELVVIRGEKL